MFRNKFNWRQVIAIAISLAALTMFPSCGDNYQNEDDPASKKPVNNNSTNSIAVVKAIVYDFVNNEEYTLASYPYSKDGFQMTLPPTVPEGSLRLFLNNVEKYDALIMSDGNLKVCSPYFRSYNSKGYVVGDAFYSGERYGDEYFCDIQFLYADRDCSVTGNFYVEDYGTFHYNCFFQEGWNIIYSFVEDGSLYSTTQKPEGVNPKWYF